ncbi:alpha/beta fold hydrolase [Devosia sp. PTR5]|uniref:Palmitoyl-protein thioesterase ABHD10, mitochondrial n=1 Tax=Devosia oryzisoli TaxID=2774138 RepID=A0A927FWW5_9HYPH|nr:alpha/beta fold hydrolase [Devosia oryzisoli]MBD8066313.1 alpha/beta fold hydrolase [Devosia oryzisoli]
MSSPQAHSLHVGDGPEARDIAVLHRPGTEPGLFWLNGFRSVMTGAKASALDALGAERGLAVTRFDYSGHGQSGGRFEDGTFSRWLEETEAVFASTAGPQIVCGSSMGGWLALLLAQRLLAHSERRLKGIVLLAPAVDAATDLIPQRFTPRAWAKLERQGYVERKSAYGDGPYRYSRALIEDGARHRLFGRVIETGCPVIILQGGKDPDVPPAHAQKLLAHILHDPVTLTLIPDGDHRLSREEDLARLRAAVVSLL